MAHRANTVPICVWAALRIEIPYHRSGSFLQLFEEHFHVLLAVDEGVSIHLDHQIQHHAVGLAGRREAGGVLLYTDQRVLEDGRGLSGVGGVSYRLASHVGCGTSSHPPPPTPIESPFLPKKRPHTL